MNPQKRLQLLVITAISGLALLAGDQLVLSPLVGAWKKRSAEIADLRKRVTQGRMLVEREHAIRQRWRDMQSNVLSSEVSIAESQLLKAFERWSAESGVGVTSVRPTWRRTDDAITLECRADIFGGLAELTRFLFLLEEDPLAVKVDALEISASDPRGRQLNLVLQVNGLTLQPPG